MKLKLSVLSLLITSALTPSALALNYDQTITAIFGGGNPSGGWTTDVQSGIELGLRAKNRNTGDTSNVNGTYSYATAPATRGLWNYEFSINSDTTGSVNLNAYEFYLGADRDASQAIDFAYVQPLFHWIDNSYGDNSTGTGAGDEPSDLGEYLTFPSLFNIAQNSQNITFGDYPGGGLALNPNATYSYELFAVANGAGSAGARLASVSITVVVGQGGAPVPEGGTSIALLGLGALALGGLSMRRKVA